MHVAISVNLGAISRPSTGATAVFTPSTGTISGTGTLTNGIFGPWAIVSNTGTAANNSANGYTFATTTGNVVPYTGATALTTFGYTSSTTANYDVSGIGGPFGVSRAANTVRYTGGAGTLASNSTQTFTFNGLMNAGTGTLVLQTTAGSGNILNVAIGGGNELVLAAASADLTINSIVSGATGAGVTIIGGTSTRTVTLAGLNTFTGDLNINSGTLVASNGLSAGAGSSLGALTPATARNIVVNPGGTLSLTVGNVLGTGGSTNTLSNVMLVVNAGGTFQSGLNGSGAGWWNKLGAIQLNGGTILLGSGANTTSFQALALIGNVSTGGTLPSIITNYAAANTASYGIHLGQNATAGQSITFTVADVTGDSNPDLTISPALLNTSSTLTASGLTKAGAGTLLLTGTSTFTGATTINAGTLQLGNGGSSGSISGSSSIANSSSLVFNRSDSVTFAAPITGTGTVTQSGTGTLNLSGASNYSGATTVRSGTLVLAGTPTLGDLAVPGAGALVLAGSATAANATLGNGGTLGLRVNSTGQFTTFSNLSFGSSANTFAIDFTGLTNPTAALVNLPAGTLTINGNVALTLANAGALATGTITLIDYGTLAGAGIFTQASTVLGPRTAGVVSNNTLNTAIILTVTSDRPKWTGLDNTSWQVGSTGPNGNWKLETAGTKTDYIEGDNVLFDDTASSGTVTLTVADVSPFATTFANTNGGLTYTLSGAKGIIGTGSLALTGGGTVILKTLNTYTGATTLSAGSTLQLGDGTAGNDGSIANTSGVTIGSGGKLVFNRNGAFTANYPIAGAGSVLVSGPGSQTLGGTNTFSGGTTVSGGATVSITAVANLGDVSGGLTLDNGTLQVTGTGITFGTRLLTVAAGGATVTITSTNQLFLNSPNTLVGSGPLKIQGNGSLNTVGAGNFRLGAANPYNGAITLLNGGSFEYGVAASIDAAATFTVNNNGEVINNGVNVPNNITITGGTNSIVSFVNGNAGIYSGTITLNATGTIALRDWYGTQTVRGGTINGLITGAGGLAITSGVGNGGTLLLGNPANDYTGPTVITSSIVSVAALAAINTVSSIGKGSGAGSEIDLILNGGTLRYTGTSPQTTDRNFSVSLLGGGLDSSGTAAVSFTTTSPFGFNSQTGPRAFTLGGTNTDANIYNGIIGDNGGATGLTKTGAGNWTITAQQTYTGTTTMAGGTLFVTGGSNRLSTLTSIAFTGAATLNFGTNSQTLAGLSFTASATASHFIVANALSVTGGNLTLGSATLSTTETADLTAVPTFTYSNAAGSITTGGQGNAAGTGPIANFLFGGSNTITAASMLVGGLSSAQNVQNFGTLRLGQTNVLNISTINVGLDKTSGTISFQTLVNPALKVRGTGGTDADRAAINISTVASSTQQQAVGLIDVSAGTIDALLSTLNIGQNTRNTTSAGLAANGTFTMAAGILDATNILIGRQAALVSGSTNSGPAIGAFNQNGGTVQVATLTLADKASLTAPETISATYILAGGTLNATTIQRGTLGTGVGAATASITVTWKDGIIGNVAGADMTVSGGSAVSGLTGGLTFDLNTTGNTSGTHVWNVSGTQTAILQTTAILSGAGNFTKTGPGTLVLSGANTFTGSTTVSAGTLTGGGSLTGSLAVAAGGTYKPGEPTGTSRLTMVGGAVNVADGSTLAFRLLGTNGNVTGTPGSGANTDDATIASQSTNTAFKLATGTLTGLVSTSAITIAIDGSAAVFTPGQAYSYHIGQSDATQDLTTLNLKATTNTVSPGTATLVTTGLTVDPNSFSLTGDAVGGVYLNFTAAAVPEPLGLLAAATVALGILQRNRRKKTNPA